MEGSPGEAAGTGAEGLSVDIAKGLTTKKRGWILKILAHAVKPPLLLRVLCEKKSIF